MMVAGWVIYALAVSLLVTGAAWFLERGLARARLPTRWMWGAALFVSVAIPLTAFLLGRGVNQGVPGISAAGTSGGSGVANHALRHTGTVARVLVEWPVGGTVLIRFRSTSEDSCRTPSWRGAPGTPSWTPPRSMSLSGSSSRPS